MAIEYQCRSCQCILRVHDVYAGRKAKCPKCGEIVIVPGRAAQAAHAPRLAEVAASKRREEEPVVRSANKQERRKRAVASVQKSAREKDGVILDAISSPDEPKARQAPVYSPKRPAAPSQEIAGDDALEPDVSEEIPRPKRRKRKRPKPQAASLFGNDSPTYLRWVIALAAYGACGMAIVGWMIASGQVVPLLFGGILWCVMMVLSVAILIVSMFISSALAGGIDYGDFFTAIAKSFFLLAPINLLSLLSLEGLGFLRWFLVLPIWVFGLMALFSLDFWEARFLIFINWFLNLGAKVLLFMLVASIFQARMTKDFDNEMPGQRGLILAGGKAWSIEDIRNMGGTIEEDGNDPDRPVIAISLHLPSFGDRELGRLSEFTDLQRLDLSGTAITDDGLIYLMAFPKLQILNVSNTKVTDAGAKRLHGLMPKVNVIR
jgi:hypothetical protein